MQKNRYTTQQSKSIFGMLLLVVYLFFSFGIEPLHHLIHEHNGFENQSCCSTNSECDNDLGVKNVSKSKSDCPICKITLQRDYFVDNSISLTNILFISSTNDFYTNQYEKTSLLFYNPRAPPTNC